MFAEATEQGDVPRQLAEMPELDSELRLIYKGYFDVGRPSGMGGGPSFADKIFWLNHYGVTGLLDQEFVLSCWSALRPIDDELSDELSERESKGKKKSSPAKSQVMGSGHVK